MLSPDGMYHASCCIAVQSDLEAPLACTMLASSGNCTKSELEEMVKFSGHQAEKRRHDEAAFHLCANHEAKEKIALTPA